MAQDIIGQRHDRTALILYGTETGNSQDVADGLGRMVKRLHFVTRVVQMDEVDLEELFRYTLVIFTLSTTGQGEFPKNARKFWKSLLRKRLPLDYLSHVTFTTFGLGDSSYPKFNFSARKLHKRLQHLGAKEIYPKGEADEQHQEGIDGTFLSWSADLRQHLLATYPLAEGVEPIPEDVLLPPDFILEIMDQASDAQSESVEKKLANLSESVDKKIPISSESGNKKIHISSESGAEHVKSASSLPPVDWASKLIYNPPPEREPDIKCPQLKEPHPDIAVPTDEKLPPPQCLPLEAPCEVKLMANKRLTPETHWQDVRELTFVMVDEWEFYPGDYMSIYPKNFPEDVQKLIDLQNWNEVADEQLHFVPRAPKFYNDKLLVNSVPPNMPLLHNCTLRALLTHNLDITAIPTRHFFEIAAHHSNDSVHAQRLHDFHNPMYTDEFFDYATRPRRSILEVLADFPSVKLPWQWVAWIFPLIRPRSYSISNGGVDRNYQEKLIKITLLVALVKYRTVLKSIRHGLCSRYLATLPEGSLLRVQFPEANSFYKLAQDRPELPLILIAPGTGLAPCRSLIWHRSAMEFKLSVLGIEVGRSYLFFGNRHKDADFFYKDEWQEKDLNTSVFTAFSRDQREKIFVQDIIREQGQLVFGLLQQGAIIYICGSSGNMPKAVRQAIIDVCMKWSQVPGRTRESFEAKLDQFERGGRLVQDTW